MKKKITVLVLVALIFSCLFSCFSNLKVYASSIYVDGGYTTALEDLAQDENFNAEDYPINDNDYSLQLIQIAESSERELFVYVYQPNSPNQELYATTINISQNLHNKLEFKNYKLTLLNYAGVFYKYLVNGLTISEDATRYYEISSIFRKWNSNYDAESGNDNTITEVSFKVAKQYTFIDSETETIMSVADTETITITDKWVGFVRYEDGFDLNLYNGGCDSHFVAFSTDKPIDKLYEADVYFTSQSYDWIRVNSIGGGEETTFGNIVENYEYLNHEQKSSFVTHEWNIFNGSIYHTYNWKRILSVDDFISSVNHNYIYECGIFNVNTETKISQSGLDNLKQKQWVLRFAETNYKYGYTTTTQDIEKTIVGNVTILRLSFETDGVTYNLGVIDNKQSGDEVPDNETNVSIEIKDSIKTMLMILLLIVLIIVLGPILPTLISIVLWVIKTALKIVVWVISLPFKIFDKRE